MYKNYDIECGNSHTNEAIAGLLEIGAITAECRDAIFSDNKPHKVWHCVPEDYQLILRSAGESNLSFRTWVRKTEDEKPFLLETVFGYSVVPGAVSAEEKLTRKKESERLKLILRYWLATRPKGLRSLATA